LKDDLNESPRETTRATEGNQDEEGTEQLHEMIGEDLKSMKGLWQKMKRVRERVGERLSFIMIEHTRERLGLALFLSCERGERGERHEPARVIPYLNHSSTEHETKEKPAIGNQWNKREREEKWK
jgi:hypothetical protein